MGEVTVFPAAGRSFVEGATAGASRPVGSADPRPVMRRTLEFTASGRINVNRPQLDAVQAAIDAAGVVGYARSSDYIFHIPSRLYFSARDGHYAIHSAGNPGRTEFAGDFRTALAVFLRCTMEAEG